MADPTNLNKSSPGAFKQVTQAVENPLTPAQGNPAVAASNATTSVPQALTSTPTIQAGGGTQTSAAPQAGRGVQIPAQTLGGATQGPSAQLGGNFSECCADPDSTGGGGADSDAVIFDDAVAGTNANIRSDRKTNQSKINNAKAGVTNFGSDTTGITAGAIGNFATIGGGDQNVATGDNSTVPGGLGNTASGNSAVAEGSFTTASGDNSHAEGQGSVASGNSAHAEGGSTASGDNSHAEGSGSTASGNAAHAEGLSHAIGDNSHAEGSNTIANALNSHAEGEGSQTGAFGEGAHAEGVNTIANALGAHTEGSSTQVTANNGHAEGLSTSAFGLAAHAEGNNTTASDADSHAEGFGTVAGAPHSHAEGRASEANATTTHAQGTLAAANRETQDAMASGSFNASAGTSQTSVLVLRGTTPGVGAGESVVLQYGNLADQSLNLEDNKFYAMKITVAAGGNNNIGRQFSQEACFRCNGGAAHLAAASTQVSIGDAGAASWTFVIGTSGANVTITFTTGATTERTWVTARVEFTETLFTVG